MTASSPLVVVLTRPVEEAPGALELVDQRGRRLDGATHWLDPQMVAFYPNVPIPLGRELRLRLVAALRTKEGAILPPGDLAAGATRDLEAMAYPVTPAFNPSDAFELHFEDPAPLPLAELENLCVLSSGTGPLPVTVVKDGEDFLVFSKTAFEPGAKVSFTWKDGLVVETSLGRLHLEAQSVTVRRGIDMRLGEDADGCRAAWRNGVAKWTCTESTVHLVLSAPISDSELARHVHPALHRSTIGDRRGHRLEIQLGSKPITITVDAGLVDVFGQTLEHPREFVIEMRDKP